MENEVFDRKLYRKIQKDLVKTMGSLASRFGRRLNISCIGMANTDEPFTALRNMVKEAKRFGSIASFDQPTMNTDSLSQIISSSVASSLSSKTELTSLETGTSRSVRDDVKREYTNAKDDKRVNMDWRVFAGEGSRQKVVGVWTWSNKLQDFAQVIDPRCKHCFKLVANFQYEVLKKTAGEMCLGCQACFFLQEMCGYRCYEETSGRRLW